MTCFAHYKQTSSLDIYLLSVNRFVHKSEVINENNAKIISFQQKITTSEVLLTSLSILSSSKQGRSLVVTEVDVWVKKIGQGFQSSGRGDVSG